MGGFIKTIQKKPPHVKRVVVLTLSGIIFFGIVSLWAWSNQSIIPPLEDDTSVSQSQTVSVNTASGGREEVLSPFGAVKRFVAETIGDVKEKISGDSFTSGTNINGESGDKSIENGVTAGGVLPGGLDGTGTPVENNEVVVEEGAASSSSAVRAGE